MYIHSMREGGEKRKRKRDVQGEEGGGRRRSTFTYMSKGPYARFLYYHPAKRNKKKEGAVLKKYFERNLDPENEEKELVGDF